MKNINIFIISTGSEITSGKSLDTNSMWIANQLTDAGYTVSGFTVLPDDPEKLMEGISSLSRNSGFNLLLMTGGLGATGDDHTLSVVRKITKTGQIRIEPAYEKLVRVTEARGPEYMKTLSFTEKQTYIPERADCLNNDVGIAPGFYIEIGKDAKLAALPGVPVEMKAMFINYLFPKILRDFPTKKKLYASRQIWMLTEGLYQKNFINKYDSFLREKDIEWGVTAKAAHIKVSFRSYFPESIDSILKLLEEEFQERISTDLQEEIHLLLQERNESVSTGESCTGGYIGKLLTDKSGSSKYYPGSVVTYSNAMKSRLLNVRESTLDKYGAVSEETAIEMLSGLENIFGTTYSIAVTGIAGPTGGSEHKPVGTVYIGIKSNSKSPKVYKHHYPYGRESFRDAVSLIALYYLYIEIKNNIKET